MPDTSHIFRNLTPLYLSIEVLADIRNFAQKFYDLWDDLHGWGHIQRVQRRCQQILSLLPISEKVNKNILEAAVYLHDIGRNPPKSAHYASTNHAAISAILASEFLATKKISEDVISAIIHIIRAHSFSLGEQANTLEAQILSDADKIDALGAVGIFRVCAFQMKHGGNIAAVISHCDKKLLKLDEELYLPASREIASRLIDRIKQFKKQLELELQLNQTL